MSEIPHTHFSEEEHQATNLGARMFAAKFEVKDNPYHHLRHADLHDAWWKGFSWASMLTVYSTRITEVSNAIRRIA